jgi:hypothetical protein
MTYTYEEITDDFGQKVIKQTDEDGLIAWIPMVAGNADYEAYFNKDKPQVEHLTEIPTKGAYLETLVTESAPTA